MARFLKFAIPLCVLGLFGLYYIYTSNIPTSVLDVLENHYANLYVNHSERKRVLIEEFKKSKQPITLKRLDAILRSIGDGHLIITKKIPAPLLESGLSFHLDAHPYLIHSLSATSIPLPARLVKVDGVDYVQWNQKQQQMVSASTPWGRDYRTLQLLSRHEQGKQLPNKLTLLSNGVEHILTIDWQPARPPGCVEGEQIGPDVYRLQVKALWCGEQLTKQFDRHLLLAAKASAVVIDLRDNNGGGDAETRYLLQHTVKRESFLYRYRYLNANLRIPRRWLNRKDQLWQKDVTESLSPQIDSNKYIGNKKILVLVNQGCFSACEVLASVYKLGNGFPLIGQRTHGGAGEPVVWSIPGTEMQLMYSSLAIYQQDERPYEGVGVTPDYFIQISLPKISSAQDPYIEKALMLLVQKNVP